MLARTPETLIILRSAQLASDEKLRRQRIANGKPKARQLNQARFRNDTPAGEIMRALQDRFFPSHRDEKYCSPGCNPHAALAAACWQCDQV